MSQMKRQNSFRAAPVAAQAAMEEEDEEKHDQFIPESDHLLNEIYILIDVLHEAMERLVKFEERIVTAKLDSVLAKVPTV